MSTTTSPLEVIRTAVTSAAEKVYGEPIRQDGLTVIPAATVGGGGGGGGGSGGPEGQPPGSGEGAGFGLKAKPAGAIVIKQGKVHWQPAIDVNRIILGGQIVAVTALLVARALIQGRARTAQERAKALSGMAGPFRRHAYHAHRHPHR